MATSCVSVPFNTFRICVPDWVRDSNVGRRTGRVALAAPSVPGAFLALSGLDGFRLPVLGGRARSKNAAISARAADLEQGVEELDVNVVNFPPPPLLAPEGTKLYVGNLPPSAHTKQLEEVFQVAGDVKLVEIIYDDGEVEKVWGFAFVTMGTVEDAQRAIQKLDGSELDGKVITVKFPALIRDGPPRVGLWNEKPPPRRDGGGGGGGGSYGPQNKLFVGNLSWSVDDAKLEILFQEYGKVVEAKVVCDRETGRSRGFGFVTLSSPSEVNLAISSLDGKEFDRRQLRVNLAGDKPPPREPRY